MKPNQTNRPFGVYVVEDREGATPFWNKVGVAWPNADARGFTVRLTSLPLDFKGQLVVRAPKDKPQGEAR